MIPLGHPSPTTTMAYDPANNLTSTTNPRGTRSDYEYDALNRSVKAIEAANVPALTATSTMLYDAVGHLLSATDPRQVTTTYAYDALGRQVLEIRAFAVPAGMDPISKPTTTWTYDAANNLVSINDNGQTTAYLYDALGRRYKETSPAGIFTLTWRDAGNREIQKVSDSGNIIFDYQYDALNRNTVVSDEKARRTTLVYDAADRVTKQITTSLYDRYGVYSPTTPRVTEYAYDALGRNPWLDDDDGFLTFFNYDLNGNVVNTADEQGWVTTYLYDALSRMREIEDANHPRTTFLYDAANNLTRQIDPSGQPTDYVYDNLDRVSTEADGNGHVTTTLYDQAGHVVAVIDPNTNRTDFGYDADGRLAWRRDTLQHLTTYACYASGLRQSMTDRLGRRTDYTYDADGQVLTEQWYAAPAAGGNLVETLTYTYEQGNLKTATNSAGAYVFTYDYDDNGVLRSVQEPFGLALTFTYDEAGNRTQVADSLGGVTSSIYDPDNRLLRRSYNGGGTSLRLDLTWWDDGTLDTLTRYSNADGAANHKVGSTAYGYYEDNRLSFLTHKKPDNTNLVSYVFGYDRDRLQTETVNGVTTTYSYDNADQVTGDGTATYGYDAAGNRNVGGYQPGPANRMATDGTYTFAYDDEGNLATRIDIQTGDLWYFYYDHHNHLTKVQQWHVTDLVPDYEIQEVNYEYDAFGNRIEKNVWTTGTGTSVERYAYDAWKTRLDVDGYDETADAIGNENWDIWADLNGSNQLVTRRMYLDAVDSVFARIGAGGATAWYLPDRLGSIRDLTDATGAIQDHIAYGAFGNIVIESTPSFGARYKYAAREWEGGIALYYYRDRFYDPFTSHFLGEDRQGSDANLYRYVRNYATGATDPSGLSAMELVREQMANGRTRVYLKDKPGLLRTVFLRALGDPQSGSSYYAGEIRYNEDGQELVDWNGYLAPLADLDKALPGSQQELSDWFKRNGWKPGEVAEKIENTIPRNADGIPLWFGLTSAGTPGIPVTRMGDRAVGLVGTLGATAVWTTFEVGTTIFGGPESVVLSVAAKYGLRVIRSGGKAILGRLVRNGNVAPLHAKNDAKLIREFVEEVKLKKAAPEWATLEPNLTRTSKESVGNLERSLKNNGIPQPSPDHVGHHVIPGSVYDDLPMLKEIGFRIDHFPNGHWVDPAFHPGRHKAYTDAMRKILGEIPMPTDAASRAAAAQQVGKVMDGAKSVLSKKNPLLRFEDARVLNPKLTHAEFTAQWEAAIRAAMK